MLIDNIWVINLDRSKDRLTSINDNFRNHGLSFSRFSAIDGKDLSEDKLETYTTNSCRTMLCNRGLIGCAMSHMKLWERLAKSRADYYVILEDDARIDRTFVDMINEIEGLMRRYNMEILNMHCISSKRFNGDIVTYKGYKFGKTLLPLSLTGYIISKTGAKKLLTSIDRITYHIDLQIAINNIINNNLEYYICEPDLISGGYIESTMGKGSGHTSILLSLIKRCGLDTLSWFLEIPAFTIKMKYVLSIYMLLLLLFLIVNNLTIRNPIINVVVILELVIYLASGI